MYHMSSNAESPITRLAMEEAISEEKYRKEEHVFMPKYQETFKEAFKDIPKAKTTLACFVSQEKGRQAMNGSSSAQPSSLIDDLDLLFQVER